jgi:hypothetical protein
MISLRPIERAEMQERWAAVRPTLPEPTPASQPLNLREVLDLGTVVFFNFRGRPYGIPPLAWRQGEQILDAYLELEAIGQVSEHGQKVLSKPDLPDYYRCMATLQGLLWRNTRSVGKLRRLRRLLGLLSNPFRQATEGEILALARFMLARRMRSSGIRSMGARHPDETFWTMPLPLPTDSQPGQEQTGSRSPGDIISTA